MRREVVVITTRKSPHGDWNETVNCSSVLTDDEEIRAELIRQGILVDDNE